MSIFLSPENESFAPLFERSAIIEVLKNVEKYQSTLDILVDPITNAIEVGKKIAADEYDLLRKYIALEYVLEKAATEIDKSSLLKSKLKPYKDLESYRKYILSSGDDGEEALRGRPPSITPKNYAKCREIADNIVTEEAARNQTEFWQELSIRISDKVSSVSESTLRKGYRNLFLDQLDKVDLMD